MDVENHVSRSIYDSLKTSFRTRLDTPPAIVVCLQQGVFPTKRDLYDKAALNARIAQPTAQTSNCAGETESIYPFLSEVVDQDILSRTMLFSEAEDTDGSQRSPLPVQTSRAERKVARDMWDTAPRDLNADISGEHLSPKKTLASPERRGTRDVSNLAAELLTALRSSSPVRMPSSGGKFGGGSRTSPTYQPQAGARAVLDATSAQRIQNQLLSLHEQYWAVFEVASTYVTGKSRPSLWLSELDPLVGTAIAGALDGQIALLQVVRATLLEIPGDTARALSERLSKEQIGYTVATFLRKHYPSPTLAPLDRSFTRHCSVWQDRAQTGISAYRHGFFRARCGPPCGS